MLNPRTNNSYWLHFIVIFTIGLLLCFPAHIYGLFKSHDFLIHLKWSKLFSEQFLSGDFYPRWLYKDYAELGSPAFFFYPPVPYFLTVPFEYIFKNSEKIWLPLTVSASFSIACSGLTAYIWLKNIVSQRSALVSSIVYMALPYHLSIDVFRRFAFAECWSFVWMPLILYFTHKIIDKKKLSVLGFSISYALLIGTHLPTTLIFSVIPLAYLIFRKGELINASNFSLIVAYGLGLGLSAIYWVPAVTTQENVNIDALKEYFFEDNFLFSLTRNYAGSRNFWFYLWFVTLITLMIAILAFVKARGNSSKSQLKKDLYFWMVIALISALMTSPLSWPIWKIISILQVIQFPWRFNTVLTLATIPLIAIAINDFDNKRLRISLKSKFGILLVILITSGFIVINRPVLKSKTYISNQDVTKFLNPVNMTLKPKEYRPKWFKLEEIPLESLMSKKIEILSGKGTVLVNQWAPRKAVLQVNATSPISLYVKQFFYPGWMGWIQGRDSQALKNKIVLQPSSIKGLLQLSLPQGNYIVKLKLKPQEAEVKGRLISIFSSLVVISSALINGKIMNKK